jgi:hypothetical protein
MKHYPFTIALAVTALFALIAPRLSAKPPHPDVGAGRVAWFDLTTTNITQSKEFYGKLFGWTFEGLKGTDYAVEIVAGGTGIGTLRTAEGKISPSNGVVYIQVSEMETACKNAKDLGGTIPPGFPFDLPDNRGAVALVIDPSGHPIGLYSRTPLKPSASPAK